MAIREEVRDGFLGDLPEDLRVKIMNIHKLVVSTVNDVIKNKAYDPIRNTTWAKTMIDEFCIIPQDKTATGSVRLYKKGKKYACMIQLTGHVNNNRNDIDHELFHDFIRNVHQTMRTTVRRKYDMTLTCESEHGEHFEGFDVWPNHKVAKELWDKFGDMKTKKAEFHSESAGYDDTLAMSSLYKSVLNKTSYDGPDNVSLMKKYIDSLSSITIPAGVTEIPANAFENCKNLKSVKLSNGLKVIGAGAFANCSSLSSITIPAGVTEIRQRAFLNCSSLRSIDIPKSVTLLGHGVFNNCKMLQYISIPAVRVIDIYTFANCDSLKNITLPDGVELINKTAFYKCENLESITIPASVKNIDRNAFYECKSLKNVKILGNPKIHIDTFYNCPNLSEESKQGITKNRPRIRFESARLIPYNVMTADMDELPFGLQEMVEAVNDLVVFTEMKTQEEYAKEAFKKKYKFTQSGNNPNEGTITVDGKTYQVVLDSPKGTCVSAGFIHLDKKFWKLKNPERRDAVLQHEIGHIVLGDTASFNGYSKFIIMPNAYPKLRDAAIEFMKQDPNFDSYEMTDWERILVKGGDDKYAARLNNKNYLRDHKDQILSIAIGGSRGVLSNAGKYIPKNAPDHLSPKEFEADRYAANRTSEKAMRKALSQAYRMTVRSDNAKYKHKLNFVDWDAAEAEFVKYLSDHPDATEEEKRNFAADIMKRHKLSTGNNLKYSEDMVDQKYRFKALRDKGMRADPMYKPGFGESSDIGYTEIIEHTDGTYEGSIVISDECEFDESIDFDNYRAIVSDYDSTKELVYNEETNQYELILTPEYAQKLYEYLATNHPQQNPITEATNDPAYNVKMNEKDAKRSLHSVSVEIINSSKPPVQYTADIYANIITKNLLPIWAGGLRKLSITLDTKCKQPIFEFKIPSMTQDFVARFVEGREPLNGLLRRNPDIKIRMSPATFKTMKDPDDAFKFFRAAIKYYESGVMKYADKIMTNFMKLDHNTKQLISTTKLGGLVTLPLQWLFQFDNVDMSDPSIFNISAADIQQINGFIKNIYSKYAAPEKEKQKILDDLNSTIQAMREACEPDDNFRSASALTEAVDNWYSGKFDAQIKQYNEQWITEQTDLDWLRNPPSPEIKLLQEKTQMKKLKKIPRDLVAYITIETESINDANDKMMIASYCLSKLEIVEWYIELIDVGSKRYIVPHSRPYLETLRTELLRCYSNIMKVKITPPSERPLIDIKYPKGYEG